MSLSSCSTHAIATSFSSFDKRIKVTPWVLRPELATCSTGVRTRVPLSEIKIISSSGFTLVARTSSPLRALVLIAITPPPPRPCLLNSSTKVRLPKPFSQAIRISRTSSSITTNDLINSSVAKRIPRTPLAVRPIARASFSSKRIALPLEANSITSWLPLVMRALTNLSPSSKPTAIKPFERILANCFSSTRFTVPLAVAKNTNGGSACVLSSNKSSSPSTKAPVNDVSSLLDNSSTIFGIGNIVVTVSSGFKPIKLTSGRPRAPRLAIGTSKPRKLKTRPVSVKHNTVECVEVTTK